MRASMDSRRWMKKNGVYKSSGADWYGVWKTYGTESSKTTSHSSSNTMERHSEFSQCMPLQLPCVE